MFVILSFVHFYSKTVIVILGCPSIPQLTGKLNDWEKFDCNCFGYSKGEADSCDPELRIMHEVTFESLVDAGIIFLSLVFEISKTFYDPL